MRTGQFLLAGILLMAATLIVGRLFAPLQSGALQAVALGATLLWLCVAAANLWFGVTTAGYSLAGELPVFLLIFGVPVLMLAGVLLFWNVL